MTLSSPSCFLDFLLSGADRNARFCALLSVAAQNRRLSPQGAVPERGDSYFDLLHGVHFWADERRYAVAEGTSRQGQSIVWIEMH